MSEVINFADVLDSNKELQPFAEMITALMEIPEENLTDSMIESVKGMIEGSVTHSIKMQAVNAMLDSFEDQQYTRKEAEEAVKNVIGAFNDFIDSLNPSEKRKQVLQSLFGVIYNVLNEAYEKYHNFNIVLPMTLEEGAHEPTYAHDTDACADLYAREATVIKSHSYGNKISTGVKIQLPEGWMAMIFPRSSTGAKTPLRLSNSVGIIDSGYRGDLGVLFDNTSENDYEINAGDRIAQLMVMPTYKFKAKVVNELETTDRGEGGFGSSGK